MSATTTWKCSLCGMEWPVKERKCSTCGHVNIPKSVTLRSDKTGKAAEITATTRLGRAVFTQRFDDDDAQFAADEQFEIVCDKTDRYAWLVRPVAGTTNATRYNGAEVPPAGCELTEGGVITIGRTRMRLVVKFK
jgi:hypothetical protein